MERAVLRSGDRTTFDIAHRPVNPRQPWLAAAQETCPAELPGRGDCFGLIAQ